MKHKPTFLKGEHIVILRGLEQDSDWIQHGYCFVVAESKDQFITDKDLRNGSTMATGVYHNNPKIWRFATVEEIIEYKRLGKPFNTLTFVHPFTNNYKIY